MSQMKRLLLGVAEVVAVLSTDSLLAMALAQISTTLMGKTPVVANGEEAVLDDPLFRPPKIDS